MSHCYTSQLKCVFCEFMERAKKELGQYPAILTSQLVNNPYVLSFVARCSHVRCRSRRFDCLSSVFFRRWGRCCRVISRPHRLRKTSSKQSKRRDLQLRWPYHETNDIKLNRICIAKFSIMIGSPHAYLSRNWRVIAWVSNYRCPIWTFCNWIPTWFLQQLREL